MDFDKLLQNELDALEGAIPYTIVISPHLYARLEKHITILKKIVDHTTTKQRWFTDAIKEKLLNDKDPASFPKATTLNVKIRNDLYQAIHARIEYIRKFRDTYSKKQWIVDAVLEKLERDENPVKLKMLDLTQPKDNAKVNLRSSIEEAKSEIENLKYRLEKMFLDATKE